MSLIEVSNVAFTVSHGDQNIDILANVNLTIEPGQSIAIVGKSGSGKSTLLSIMAGLQKPTSGMVKTPDTSNEQTKNRHGFIFQDFHLIPGLTCLQNVMLPLLIAGIYDEAIAVKCLAEVGMDHRLSHYPKTLSGGEKQRVAIARAIVIKAPVIFADEPTGNLDTSIGHVIENLLLDLVKEKQMSLVLVTHNSEFAKRCNTMYSLQNGMLTAITE